MKTLTQRLPLTIVMALAVTVLSVFSGATANAAQVVNVPVTASSQVAITNVTLSTTSTSARAQFDYALVNGATSAFVDVTVDQQQSFDYTTVTGPGHYDVTLSGITVTNSTQFVIISAGNDNFVIPRNSSPCGDNSNTSWNRFAHYWQPTKYVFPHRNYFNFFF